MKDITKPATVANLDELQIQKALIHKELRAQKELMETTAKSIFAPAAPAADKGTAIMHTFNTGLAVVEGVMIGVKVIRRIRKAFKHK